MWKGTIVGYKEVFNFSIKAGEGQADESWKPVTSEKLIDLLSQESINHAKDFSEFKREVKLKPKTNHNWNTLRIATYSPKVQDEEYYYKKVNERITMLIDAIGECLKLGAMIVVGPEFFSTSTRPTARP